MQLLGSNPYFHYYFINSRFTTNIAGGEINGRRYFTYFYFLLFLSRIVMRSVISPPGSISLSLNRTILLALRKRFPCAVPRNRRYNFTTGNRFENFLFGGIEIFVTCKIHNSTRKWRIKQIFVHNFHRSEFDQFDFERMRLKFLFSHRIKKKFWNYSRFVSFRYHLFI